jgi:hypothetical protein
MRRPRAATQQASNTTEHQTSIHFLSDAPLFPPWLLAPGVPKASPSLSIQLTSPQSITNNEPTVMHNPDPSLHQRHPTPDTTTSAPMIDV